MDSLSLLETRNLSRHFGGIKAVDNVNFRLDEGDIRALIGPNGAGKTTLVSLITGRVEETSGSVFFAGQNVTNLPAHKRIGKGISYTFQITSIFGNLTCFENVRLATQQRKRRKKGLIGATNFALEQVGLQTVKHHLAKDLSYGHQRLLEIAMGIAQRPRLLILDEPTQGLAMAEIRDFVSLIRDLGENTTILLIEHNMDVVMSLARNITVMDQGQIIAEGTPQEIRADARVQEAYLGG